MKMEFNQIDAAAVSVTSPEHETRDYSILEICLRTPSPVKSEFEAISQSDQFQTFLGDLSLTGSTCSMGLSASRELFTKTLTRKDIPDFQSEANKFREDLESSMNFSMLPDQTLSTTEEHLTFSFSGFNSEIFPSLQSKAMNEDSLDFSGFEKTRFDGITTHSGTSGTVLPSDNAPRRSTRTKRQPERFQAGNMIF